MLLASTTNGMTMTRSDMYMCGLFAVAIVLVPPAT